LSSPSAASPVELILEIIFIILKLILEVIFVILKLILLVTYKFFVGGL
jgi:hypothetical protein